MSKAIKITKENRVRLEVDYNYEEGYLVDSIGKFILAEFGEDAVPFATVVSTKKLEEDYAETGKILRNGYFEVMAR